MLHLTEQDAARIGIPDAGTAQDRRSASGRSKYRAQRVRAYGRLWASKAECRRYEQLLQLGDYGVLINLEVQPRFPLRSAGVTVAEYVADFCFQYASTGLRVVEDVKGVRTPLYVLKRKLFQTQYPQIMFREVSIR